MLNETWRLWQALMRAAITPEAQHPLIKPLPTTAKHLLRIRLDDSGDVQAVEEIADDHRAGIRRIVQTSDGSFPVVKVNQPLLSIRARSPIWRLLNRRRNRRGSSRKQRLLARCVRLYPPREWKEAGHNWTKSREKSELVLKGLANGTEAPGMATLCRRFQAALDGDDAAKMIRSIAETALASWQQGHLSSTETLQELLVGRGKGGNGRDTKLSVLLVLDVDQDSDDLVYDKKVWRSVAGVLPMNIAAKKSTHAHRADQSAFGTDNALLTGPFPQVWLPVLNAYFPLLSMASDGDKAKCNRRYGLTEFTVIPVSEQAAMRMQDALAWIVCKEREGETWSGVANGKFIRDRRKGTKRDDRDLLIAFVEDKPHVHAQTAKYVGQGQDVSDAQFEVNAKAIADAFNADPQIRPTSKLHFFLLHKATDGQVQVALDVSPTVQDVLDAAERWVTAAKGNAPYVRLWLPAEVRGDQERKAGHGRVMPPFPDQVVRLLSHQWVRGGTQSLAVIGPSLGDVLDMMLRTEGKCEPAARRMLKMLIHRLTPLLIGTFGAQHAYVSRKAQKKHEQLFNYPRPSCEAALRAVATAAILLEVLGEHKEQYVNNAPYQVGQVLSMADTLHRDYCTVVRRGQLPNSLIGTALMRRALDNPAAAVGDLGERMMEYVRWAKTAHPPQGDEREQERIAVHQARKVMRRYQPLASSLGTIKLPTESDDVEKAQLLLGFLASPPVEDQEQDGRDDEQ